MAVAFALVLTGGGVTGCVGSQDVVVVVGQMFFFDHGQERQTQSRGQPS